ncbi:hypothetical protein KR032_010487 [Drosophila birchii]|nr:hypothetical protein KR032_010487 [Drosophila birchii]
MARILGRLDQIILQFICILLVSDYVPCQIVMMMISPAIRRGHGQSQKREPDPEPMPRWPHPPIGSPLSLSPPRNVGQHARSAPPGGLVGAFGSGSGSCGGVEKYNL